MPDLVHMTTPEACHDWVRAAQSEGLTVGLVPTMGALHEGHLSLVEAAKQKCDRVIATIFVNPTQFGENEDFAEYPRDLDRDAEKLISAGADALFAPEVEAIYPPGDSTLVQVGAIAEPWEGVSRPTHYTGVATVVLKLLLIAPADRAYFGQKDYQQTLVIKQMVRDLHVPTEIVVCPTIREPDGLAKSSRNAYLSNSEREQALVLSRSLQLVQQSFAAGQTDAKKLQAEAEALILSTAGTAGVELEYMALLASGSVESVDKASVGDVVVVAARVGQTRLIDNLILK